MLIEDQISFFVPCLPVSANRIWRKTKTGHIYVSKEATNFFNAVKDTLNGLKMPDDWEFCAVELEIFPKIRRGDVDNLVKSSLDALTKCGFWKDDNCVAMQSSRFNEPGQKSGVSYTIRHVKSKFPYKLY